MTRLCVRCWERPLQIDGIRSPYRFEGAIRNAVHSLKYRNLRAMAPVLAGLLADFVVSQSIEADLLVPAPLHPRRERSRGYNQSLLLARETGALLNVETRSEALRRVQNTPSQASVSSEDERQANVVNAFQAVAGPGRREARHNTGRRMHHGFYTGGVFGGAESGGRALRTGPYRGAGGVVPISCYAW